MTRSRRAAATALTLLAVACWLNPPASAHQLQPPPIGNWGPFAAPTLRCLQTLHHATDDCLHRVLAARRSCLDRQLAGQPCDTAARDARIVSATRRVEQSVDRGCLGGQLTELFFRTYGDAKTDLTTACTTQADAAMTMIYGPMLAAQSASAASSPTRACAAAVVESGLKLLRMSVGLKSRAFDRIGEEVLLQPSQKLKLLTDADAAIATIQQGLGNRMEAQCADFDTLFGRNAMSLLTDVGKRATCVVTAVYVQSTIFCSPVQ